MGCQIRDRRMAHSRAPGEGGGWSSGGKPVDTFVLLPWFPRGSDSKESACPAGDPGSIPGSGRSPGGGNGSHFIVLA